MTNPRISQAVTEIKSGNKETGRRLLMAVISDDPQNENAWLWLALAVRDPTHQRRCLETVLRINPNNELAKTGLARLHASQSNSIRESPRDKTHTQSSHIAKYTDSVSKTVPCEDRKRPTYLLLILGSLVLLCLCSSLPFTLLMSGNNEKAAHSSVPQERDIPPTWTPPSSDRAISDLSRQTSFVYGEVAINRPLLAEYAQKSSLKMSFYRDLTYNDGTYHHTMCTRDCRQKLVMRSETYEHDDLDNLDYSFIYSSDDEFVQASFAMLAVVNLAIPDWEDLNEWYLNNYEQYLLTGQDEFHTLHNNIDMELFFFYDAVDLEDAVLISVKE